MPAPMRIVEHGARERDHVGLAFRDDRFGSPWGGDETHGAGGDAGLAPDFFGKRNIMLATKAGRASALMPPEEMQTKSTPTPAALARRRRHRRE